MPTTPPGRGYGRVIEVLELLASEGAGLTGSEMSRRLSLPKSTVFLLLQHLVDRGIVSLDPLTRGYRTGPALVQLAFQITAGIDLVRAARPHLDRLSEDTTDDVYLGIRHGTRFIYVDKLEGTQPVRDYGGEVVAAVHISTLRARALSHGEFLIERMCARAGELSRDLGGC